MIDIEELDKRIMLNDAWNASTNYETIIVANENSINQLALSLGKDKIDKYKEHKIMIDKDLEDEIVILKTEKE